VQIASIFGVDFMKQPLHVPTKLLYDCTLAILATGSVSFVKYILVIVELPSEGGGYCLTKRGGVSKLAAYCVASVDI
jgi:hypothetical protein